MPKDQTRCVARVSDETGWHFRQCSRKRGHGPDGKYCKQHAKRFEPKPVKEIPIRENTMKDIIGKRDWYKKIQENLLKDIKSCKSSRFTHEKRSTQ